MPVETRAAEQRRLNAPPPAVPVPFTCVACMDDHPALAIDVAGNPICPACYHRGIAPQFEAALRDEARYPPRWADQPLGIQPFADQGLMTPEFRQDYELREQEYAILARDRVYCSCGQFLGARATHTVRTRCVRDGRRTCPDCLGTFQGTVRSHICHSSEEIDHFQGLVQGRDYQICTCGCVVELTSGCNHMTCRMPACRREFCYICGEDAVEESNHWAPGGCPKYHQPGAANARHALFHDEEEDEEDEEYDLLEQDEQTQRVWRFSNLLDHEHMRVVEGDAENAIMRAIMASPENQLRRMHARQLLRIQRHAHSLAYTRGLDPDVRVDMGVVGGLLNLMLDQSYNLSIYVMHMMGGVGPDLDPHVVFGPLEVGHLIRVLTGLTHLGAFPNVMQRLAPIVEAYMHAAEGRFEALNGMARNALQNHAADE
ncbi:Hypothetical predicted protein [Lecanosticta acicola]|uniref:RING-type domain-containing protein n=1 Tax=Lecanosticta acicola TaxID=111012 RepID=A0AAI8Z6V6_9PEZI|nr:Hypothetical predicted protein [Lecanosticta acicola]